MAKAYYTLAEFDGAAWYPQFGDYSRRTVEAERLDMLDDYRMRGIAEADGGRGRGLRVHHYAKRLLVIRTGDTQAEIEAGIAALNAPLGLCEHG